MSTIKIKTQNGYEKVEISSCLPANVEFGEPEDWTSRWNTSFVADCDGILCVFASQGNMSGTLWCRDNGDIVAAEGITTGYSGSITLSIKNGRTYSIESTNGLTFSVKRATFYPFKTKPVNDYSTDEICIGKWIDGKPLYRKVIVSETIPTQGTVVVQNADTLVNQYGSMKYIPNDQQFNFPFNDGNNQIRLMINNSSHEIFLVASGDYINYSYVGKAKFVVEYTKQ